MSSHIHSEPASKPVRRGVVWGAALLCAVGLAAGEVRAERVAPASPDRIVSLNPSLTAILVAIGQAQRLVGVDDYSAQQIGEVAQLPKVGGLFNPSLEAVVALEPDLVVLVPSAEQRDFRERVEALGIAVESFRNHRFEQVLENIARLGALTGAGEAAQARIEAIGDARERVERAVAKQGGGKAQTPTIAVVLQRDPLFVVGGDNFIDTMLTIAGTNNIAAQYREAYPRVSMEWLVARSPELLVDLSPEAARTMAFWGRWPNVAAVKDERLIALDAALISMPGPALDQSLLLLARTLWGAGFLAEASP
ncbi:MAG: ABC transporter substrate-binding protein [bacterium]|nr:ABC transporter substrate-binding protein [bacterium]